MSDARMNRRLTGLLSARLAEAGLDLVPDGRDPRGIRWDLGTLLRAVVVGAAAGATSLAEVERHTDHPLQRSGKTPGVAASCRAARSLLSRRARARRHPTAASPATAKVIAECPSTKSSR
jgi:hypothetical protein